MMSAPGRCNSGRGSAISKESRIVNGGGSVVAGGDVNQCEQVLIDQNEMMMGASKITVSADQPVAPPKSRRVYPPSSNETNKLKEFNQVNTMFMQELYNNAVKDKARDKETISELKKQVEFVSDL